MPADALTETVVAPRMPADALTETVVAPPGERSVALAAEAIAHASSAPEAPSPPGDTQPPGWRRAIQRHGATLIRGAREPLPEAVAALAPVQGALASAGEQATLVVHDRRYSLWGFPDLQRPSSRVLAVGSAGPRVEIVALHREQPAAGTCGIEGFALGRGSDGALATGEALSLAHTGRAAPQPGRPLALSGGSVYLERDGRVVRWDGSRLREEGSVKQVLATLVLEWSQR